MENNTLEEDERSVYRTFSYIDITIIFFSNVLNLIVVLIFIKMLFKEKAKLSNFMLCIQAITDLVVCIAYTFDAIMCYSGQHTSKEIRYSWIFTLEYSQYLAVNILFVITVERYLAVNYPFTHRHYVTIRTMVLVSITVFIFSSIPAFVSVLHLLPLNLKYEEAGMEERVYALQMTYQIVMGTITLVAILAVFSLIVTSYRTIRKSIIRRIKTHTSQTTQSSTVLVKSINSERKKHKRIVIILFVMCSIYTIAYLPFTILKICFINYVKHTMTEFQSEVLLISLAILYYSSALINPLITLTFKEDYAKQLMNFFHTFPKPNIMTSDTILLRMVTKEKHSRTQESSM